MKHILLAALLALFNSLHAAPLSDWPVDQVASNTYVIHGPLGIPNPKNRGFMNNPGFVVTSAGVVVIDPGSSLQIGEMVLQQIKTITSQPVVAVFNTHIHGDHWLGNHAIRNAYPEAAIYGHENMIAMVDAGEGEIWRKRILRLTKGATQGTQVVKPNHAVTGSEQITIGDTQFNLLFEPKAHSNSDIMISVPTENVLFLGDNVLFGRLGQMTHGSFKGNIAAVEMALQSNARTFIPGHGKSGGREVPEAYLNYLVTMREKVAELYEEGLSDFEMKPKVKKAIKNYHSWVGFQGEHGRHLSLLYLEIENEMF